jgi:prepilin-type N-terminal cleavage/methylation domain-containing protein
MAAFNMLSKVMTELIKYFGRILVKAGKDNRGMTLIELLIALTIMGLTVVFVGGLFTSFKVLPVDQDAIMSETLARSQMEYTMSESYTDDASSYPAMPGTLPTGYFVDTPVAVPIDPDNIGSTPDNDLGIQKITVNVYKGSSNTGTLLLTLVGYKLKK